MSWRRRVLTEEPDVPDEQALDDPSSQAPPPDRPGQAPPPGPWLIPLTVPELRRLLAAAATRLWPPGHIEHWSAWMRTHQARARWFHQRTRLERDREITMNPLAIAVSRAARGVLARSSRSRHASNTYAWPVTGLFCGV